MKKLVLLLAVVFSASLFSCGNAEKAEATDSVAADTAATEVVEAIDSAANGTAAANDAVAAEVK